MLVLCRCLLGDAGVVQAFFLFLVVRCGAGIHFRNSFASLVASVISLDPAAVAQAGYITS